MQILKVSYIEKGNDVTAKDKIVPNRYGCKHTRELCHGVKEFDLMAIQEMAEYFACLGILDEDSILVPAPQHTGRAEYTKEIAQMAAKVTKATVVDAIGCIPHEGVYQMKKKGKISVPEFYLTTEFRDEGKKIFFLDNVLATGTTFWEAKKLIRSIKPLVYAIDF